MTAKSDSAESSIKMDCHEFNKLNSRNDKVMAIPHKNAESNNDTSPPTVFASETKQSIKNDDFINNADSNDSIELNRKMDCHANPYGLSRNDGFVRFADFSQ